MMSVVGSDWPDEDAPWIGPHDGETEPTGTWYEVTLDADGVTKIEHPPLERAPITEPDGP